MKFKTLAKKTDWKLLKVQKETLYKFASCKGDRVRITEKDKEHFEGIICLLDIIQDKASEIIGADEVFGMDFKYGIKS